MRPLFPSEAMGVPQLAQRCFCRAKARCWVARENSLALARGMARTPLSDRRTVGELSALYRSRRLCVRHQECGKVCDNIGEQNRLGLDALQKRGPLLLLGGIAGKGRRQSIGWLLVYAGL